MVKEIQPSTSPSTVIIMPDGHKAGFTEGGFPVVVVKLGTDIIAERPEASQAVAPPQSILTQS